MDGIKRFFNQALMSYRSLFAILSLQNYILVKTMMPLLQLIFFVLTAKYAYHATDLTPWVIGNALILASFNAFFGVSTTFINDRNMGTLKVVIASPINKFVVFIGRTFMHILDGLLSVTTGILLGILLFNIDLSYINIPLFILSILIGIFSVMGLGVLIGIFALITREIHMLLNICYSLLLVFSGANIPRENLPGFLQGISYCLPLTRSIEASKMLLRGKTNILFLLSQEFLIGCIYIIFALLMYQYLEKKARNGATMDAY